MTGRAAVAAFLSLFTGAAGAQDRLLQWRLEAGRFLAGPGAPGGALRVGSLQKPFVARAWAESHPGARTPRHDCPGGDACWLRGGHGRLGLAGATAVSCNAYFRALADATPADALARVLRAEGFLFDGTPDADGAIGLARPGAPAVAIAPEALLRAYARLVGEPWPRGEAVRGELLAGMRGAALDGTARGLAARAPYAKTGTAPSVEGLPLTTSGLALAADDAGSAWLGLLSRGTGREAAAALAAASPLAAARTALAPERVRVTLFALLQPRRVAARNVGAGPQRARGDWVGPGSERELRAGDRLGDGLWELRIGERGLVRRLQGAIDVEGREGGSLALTAAVSPAEYVAGVAAAELAGPERERLVALGAAVFRFLAAGPRHARSDVCDSTHCAYFVGRGPRVAWPDARRARLFEASAAPEAPVRLDASLWAAIRQDALRPGPTSWTSHCGGEPLSPRFVWGGRDAFAAACPRHGRLDTRSWSRVWSRADAEAAFGVGVRGIEVASDGGTWRLRVHAASGEREWLYDDAHRALARILGWGALPSPADRVADDATGFRAEGRGLGHRVGLCLAD